jgi:hypothetical protein
VDDDDDERYFIHSDVKDEMEVETELQSVRGYTCVSLQI